MSRSSKLLLTFFVVLFFGHTLYAQNKPVPVAEQIGVLPTPPAPKPFMPGIQDIVKPPSPHLQQQQQYYNKIEQEVSAHENRRQTSLSADNLERELQPDVNAYPVIYPGKYALTRNYWDALFKLEAMAQVDSLSLVHGIYLVENAYLDGKLPFDKFQKLIDN